jgi:hypothetical protein
MSEDATFSIEIIDAVVQAAKKGPCYIISDRVVVDGETFDLCVVPFAVPQPKPHWNWRKIAVRDGLEGWVAPGCPGKLFIWDEYIPLGGEAL